MRKNRLILLILWILSLLVISFYGGNISYGIFLFLTMLPVSAIVYIIYVIWRFKIYQSTFGGDVVANHRSPYYFTLQNEDLVAFSSIRVNFFADFSTIEGLNESDEYELLPHDGVRKETTILCKYRGYYPVGINSIVITDMFHLFSIKIRNRELLKIKVKPDLIYIDAINSINVLSASSRSTSSNATLQDVVVRDYVAGDDLRHVNWKASARENKLMVRKQIGEEKQQINIILDSKRYSENPNIFLPKENKCLEILLALMFYMVQKNIPSCAYFYSRGLKENTVATLGQFEQFYDTVADFQFNENSTMNNLKIEALQNASILDCKISFMILQSWDENSAHLAAILNENEIEVVAFVVENADENNEIICSLPRTKVITVDSEADVRDFL